MKRGAKSAKPLRNGNIIEFLRVVSNFVVRFIPESSWFYRRMALLSLKLTEKKRLSKRKRLRFDVSLVDHCNLNCKYCCTFSPLAEETFADAQTLASDLRKLSEITGGEADDIGFYGGEPLLHPGLADIMGFARGYFPDAEMFIITNGILLGKQPDEFWEACRKNRINVRITRYPIKLDFEALKAQAEKNAVSLKYGRGVSEGVGGNTVPIKSMWKCPFDLNGAQDLEHSWKYCREANNCINLRDGKIYPCHTITFVRHFNKYFNANMAVSQDDVLELSGVRNLDEILTFLSTPKPFCRYCKRKDIMTGLTWGISKREISEWV